MADQLTPEQKAELDKLTVKEIENKKRLNELNELEEAYLDRILEKKRKTLDYTNNQLELSQKLLEKYQAEAKSLEDRLIVRQQMVQVEKDYQASLEAQLKSNKITLEEFKKRTRESQRNIIKQEQAIALADKFIAGQKESVDQAAKLGDEFGKSLNAFKGGLDIAGKMGQVFKGMQSIRFGPEGLLAAISGGAMSILGSFLNSIINLAIGLIDLENNFMKVTGASREMAAEVTTTYRALDEYGVTMEEAGQAHQDLFNNMSNFNLTVGPEQRAQLAATTATLVNYGVASADLTKGLQIQNKAFGLTGTALEEANRDLFTFAQEIGVAPAQMAADFASAGESLAKFGDDGIDTFKELARVAKITGMEIGKLKQMTDVADTFEGAATTAAKLNAAIGGNMVNAMDLMMETDPTARFEMMTGALKDAGLQFNDMSYYQRIYYAQAMGLKDVNELALVMSGRQDLLAGSTMKTAEEQEALAENSKTVQTFMEQLQAVLAQNADELLALIGGGQGLMEFLKNVPGYIEAVVRWTKRLSTILGALAVAYIAMQPLAMYRAVQARKTAAAVAQASIATGKSTASIAANTTSLAAQLAAIEANTLAQAANANATGGAGLAKDKSTVSTGALATAEGSAAAAGGANAAAQGAQVAPTAAAGATAGKSAALFQFLAVATWESAAAILAMGVSIGLTIAAFALLVWAFKGMGYEAIAAVAGILAVSFGIKIMTIAMSKFGTNPGVWAGAKAFMVYAAGVALIMALVTAFVGWALPQLIGSLEQLAITFGDLGPNAKYAAMGLVAVGVSIALMIGSLSMLMSNPVTGAAAAWILAFIVGITLLAAAIGYIVEGFARFQEAVAAVATTGGDSLQGLGTLMDSFASTDGPSSVAIENMRTFAAELTLIANISFSNLVQELSQVAATLQEANGFATGLKELQDISLESTAEQVALVVESINNTTTDEAAAFTGAMTALAGAVAAASAEAPAPRQQSRARPGSQINSEEAAAPEVRIEKIEITLSDTEVKNLIETGATSVLASAMRVGIF